MVATTQLRLAPETEDEKSARLEYLSDKGALAYGDYFFPKKFEFVSLCLSAGCVSTFRNCVQGYLEWLPLVFCFLPSLHSLRLISCPLEKL